MTESFSRTARTSFTKNRSRVEGNSPFLCFLVSLSDCIYCGLFTSSQCWSHEQYLDNIFKKKQIPPPHTHTYKRTPHKNHEVDLILDKYSESWIVFGVWLIYPVTLHWQNNWFPPPPFFIGLLVGDGTTNLKLDRS